MIGERPTWSDVRDRPRGQICRVEQVAPLRLSYGGTLIEDLTPINCVSGLAVGDRVWCHLEPGNRSAAMQVVVLGLIQP